MWRSAKKQSDKHRELIRAIYSAMMQDMGFGKEEALRMRREKRRQRRRLRRRPLAGTHESQGQWRIPTSRRRTMGEFGDRLWRSSKKQSDNHRELVGAIHSAMMQDMAFGKEEALTMTIFYTGVEMLNAIL